MDGIPHLRFAAACAACLAAAFALQLPVPAPPPARAAAQSPDPMPDPLHQRIDQWIERNHLNAYGDPRGTMYTGGTPLFDERTGETEDRYDYILKRHPELKDGPGKR